MTEKVHGVENEIVNERTENHLEISFTLSAGSDFFDGHFPEFKLLPAVAQFEIVTRFSKKYFNTDRGVEKIRRMKFSSPILPGTRLLLVLDFAEEKNQVTFTLSDAKGGQVYSNGIFSAFSKPHVSEEEM